MMIEQLELLDLHAHRARDRSASSGPVNVPPAAGTPNAPFLMSTKPCDVRILPGPADVNIGLERAGHVGELGRESLDDRQVRSAVDLTCRSICVPGRRLDVPGAAARLEQRRRHAALRGDRLGRPTAAASASMPMRVPA